MANTTHTNETGNPGGRMREPPEVKVELLEMRDLPKRSTAWEEIKTKFLPVDFLLLTVKDCEQLSCLSFLKDIEKGYTETLGPVYFGFNDSKEPKLKIAVLKCLMGSSCPGGSMVVTLHAVPILEPKAVICVGFCGSLNEKKAKLGDVILASKLRTYALVKERKDGIEDRNWVVHPSSRMANLIKDAGAGWKAPLTNTEDLTPTVRRDGVFLTGPTVLDNPQRLKELKNRFPQGTAIEMEGEGASYAEDPQPGPSTQMVSRSTQPSNGARIASRASVKAGGPSEDELQELALEIIVIWKKLGRRLGFKQGKIDGFDKDNDEIYEKAYCMLLAWRDKEGSNATYKVLYDALCHKVVNFKRLAEQFCCE